MQKRIDRLNLYYKGRKYDCKIPCSLFSVLSERKVLPHPYKDFNEREYISAAENDCTFESEFDFLPDENKLYALTAKSIDTVAALYLNGKFIGETKNAFYPFKAEISGKDFVNGKNNLKIVIASPIEYLKGKNKRHYVDSMMDTPKVGLYGRAALRKPQYSFGWDWGAALPDSGIYEPIIIEEKRTELDDLIIRQIHKDGKVKLILSSFIECDCTLFSPENKVVGKTTIKNGVGEITVENPKLWWCNRLGEQPLYALKIEYKDEFSGKTIVEERTIGLRSIEISQNNDEWGREFAFVINGKKIFACGTNYIPEDHIIPWYDEEKTEKLLRKCKAANFNMIRVWGGGIYPSDKFYDLCDRYGIIVWQDFMFACQSVYLSERFKADVKKEVEYQVKRCCSHPSLGLLCGNNEIEYMIADRRLKSYDFLMHRPWLDVADYIELFEHIIPDICEKYAPDVFYWGCSPSSGGGFYMSMNENFGDSHIWNCWAKGEPLDAYKKHYPRFCSEFGFCSYPSAKTIEGFSDKKIEKLSDEIVKNHFKKLVYAEDFQDTFDGWVEDVYGKSESIAEFCKNSQILQGRMNKAFIEHMRINRGRCMGALYWQLNDSWDCVSWSTTEYDGRDKASMYYAAQAFKPITCAAEITDGIAKIYAVNDTKAAFNGKLKAFIAKNDFTEVFCEEKEIYLSEFGCEKIFEFDCEPYIKTERNKKFLGLVLTDEKGEAVSFSSEIFVADKNFEFLPEKYEVKKDGDAFVIISENYRRNVDLGTKDYRMDFCDIVQREIRVGAEKK